MATFGKFEPDFAVREGWARDQEDEVSFDGYNAFLQITTNDGTSGFSVTNAAGGVAFTAKSDGDGYVARNLGIGTYNPVEKLEVIGVTKTDGFQLTEAPFDGYVLTSDGTGVGTWRSATVASAAITVRDEGTLVGGTPHTALNFVGDGVVANDSGGGLAEINISHRDQDQLVHKIAETSFEEITYNSTNRVTNVTVWTDAGKTTKVREQQFTYNNNLLSQAVTIQYDEGGSAVETLTETFSYNANRVTDITRTLS